MKPIKIPFWMGKGQLKKYADFLLSWFDLVTVWLKFTLTFHDIETVDIKIVDLFAWQRDIERINSEPEWLYRRRVKYAYHNAKDAGTLAGFKRIWQRLELGYLVIDENVAGRDWDVIQLEIDGQTLADHEELLRVIISKYGLTCRRYEWIARFSTTIKLRVQTFGNTTGFVTAQLLGQDRYEWLNDVSTEINMRVQTFENAEHNAIAKLDI
tara:strand:+ start:102 stop:734 length:633 start_codon:yes stop_codon:yes gene_type:complete